MDDDSKQLTNTEKRKPPNAGMGRPKGSANKATKEAREAIAEFVNGNADRLTGWLDQVAEGVLKPNGEDYAVAPNPAKAFELYQSVIEYHVPKLARTEHTGEGGKDLFPAVFKGL